MLRRSSFGAHGVSCLLIADNGVTNTDGEETMRAARMHAIERSTYALIAMSTSRLIDDTRVRLVVPLKAQAVFTATIAEIIAAKAGKA